MAGGLPPGRRQRTMFVPSGRVGRPLADSGSSLSLGSSASAAKASLSKTAC